MTWLLNYRDSRSCHRLRGRSTRAGMGCHASRCCRDTTDTGPIDPYPRRFRSRSSIVRTHCSNAHRALFREASIYRRCIHSRKHLHARHIRRHHDIAMNFLQPPRTRRSCDWIADSNGRFDICRHAATAFRCARKPGSCTTPAAHLNRPQKYPYRSVQY